METYSPLQAWFVDLWEEVGGIENTEACEQNMIRGYRRVKRPEKLFEVEKLGRRLPWAAIALVQAGRFRTPQG